MKQPRRERRGKGKGKRKGKEFMDAALDAFIRDQSLQKWHEVEGLMSGAEIEARQALRDSGDFLERGPYRDIWRRNWAGRLSQMEDNAAGAMFAGIEEAVRGGVVEEREERRQSEDTMLEDSAVYKEFISRAMEKLLGEASGEIEELD